MFLGTVFAVTLTKGRCCFTEGSRICSGGAHHPWRVPAANIGPNFREGLSGLAVRGMNGDRQSNYNRTTIGENRGEYRVGPQDV